MTLQERQALKNEKIRLKEQIDEAKADCEKAFEDIRYAERENRRSHPRCATIDMGPLNDNLYRAKERRQAIFDRIAEINNLLYPKLG